MRVSGRKLRLAAGTGIAALMLTLGVSSVGATAPEATGNTNGVVVNASATGSRNPNATAANFRDAVRISRGTGGATLNGCAYIAVGTANNAKTTATFDVNNCGTVTISPAAYPLWEEQNVPPSGNNGERVTAPNTLVVPPTLNPRPGVHPTKEYIITTFR